MEHPPGSKNYVAIANSDLVLAGKKLMRQKQNKEGLARRAPSRLARIVNTLLRKE